MKRSPLVVAGVGVIALTVPTADDLRPLLVWNATASVPTGLYHIVDGEPHRGSLVVIRLPEPFRKLAHLRGYVPASVIVIKPIAALRGDTLCRQGNAVSINGRIVAFARKLDKAGRPLPRWRGCHLLGTTAVGVISKRPDSFDSRYFGPLDQRYVVGVAIPVWTNNELATPTR